MDQDAAHRYQISVADEQAAVDVDPERLVRIAEFVLESEGVKSAELSVALVHDPIIRDVNRRFLNHDYLTDVISFVLSDAPETTSSDGSGSAERIEGEIVISGETAARVARELGHAAADELALYLVHGLLHLCGYDDHAPADRARMEQRQQTHLQNLGIRPHYQGDPSPGICLPPSQGN